MAKEESSAVMDITNIREVTKDELLDAVREYCEADMRFMTMTGFDRGDQYEVLYHFDDNYTLRHLQVKIAKDEELPSITPFCFCAFLSENEVKELFGVKITNIAIDYNGRLLIAENCPAAPMLKDVVKIADSSAANGVARVIQTRSAKPAEAGAAKEGEE